MVYSNYSVLIEVVRSHPVSVISEATNIFINRQSGIIVTLDGRKSHDPDFPNNTLRYVTVLVYLLHSVIFALITSEMFIFISVLVTAGHAGQ